MNGAQASGCGRPVTGMGLAFGLALGLALALGGAARAQVEEPAAGVDDTKGRQTAERLGLDLSSNDAALEITANRQTLSETPSGGRVSVWEGDVLLRQGDLVLRSQKLTISFASEDVGGAVERIEAEGEVEISQRDVELRCDSAVYEEQTCQAVCERRGACAAENRSLSSPAVLRQGEDVVRGGRIEFDVCTGDFQVSCGASGYFQPRQRRNAESSGDADAEAE